MRNSRGEHHRATKISSEKCSRVSERMIVLSVSSVYSVVSNRHFTMGIRKLCLQKIHCPNVNKKKKIHILISISIQIRNNFIGWSSRSSSEHCRRRS
ncbi:hypothetical protein NY2A_b327L [Paramecium bursaria Chlorella virus NY2A]|uniref:Uncharacterized protein b327L n=1 Tax=Paramecium bursaria Chlorella virus NY2A TaxID=46021 RepID=A7IWK2_PBCVN|nr:hypothetical protein NY2A_b327L [Paramecium bursaria Chlorella virus NY2A]ABT14726.1 hypothetical protein NY2A_b327L [Paramecium bursaria Chlorella virus NY2A]